jgi:hypothetical protein
MSSSIGPGPTLQDAERGGCFSSLLFAMLLLAGGVVFWEFFLEPWRDVLDALRWDVTPCQIQESAVEPVRRGPATPRGPAEGARGGRPTPVAPSAAEGDTHRAVVRYRYTYDGISRVSQRIWFIRSDTGSYAEMKQIVDRYPQGSTAECFVNPRAPHYAVLEREFRPVLLLAVFPLSIGVLGLAGLLSNVLRLLGPPPLQRLAAVASARIRPSRRIRIAADGTVTCRAPSGAARAVAVLVLALLFNALVSFLVSEVVDTWSDGVPGCYGWLLSVSSVPFVLAGVGLLSGAVYMTLRVFNPRPTLVLSSCSLPLGGSMRLGWRFSRGIAPIARLRLVLEGRQEATYARGGRVLTDSETFRTIRLVDTSDPRRAAQGQVELRMPDDTVPTLHGQRNAIVWVLRLCAQVPRWPSIEHELEILVAPASPASPAGAERTAQTVEAG